VIKLATGRWISLGTPVSSTNKTHRHDITEILLKVALNIITEILLKVVLKHQKSNQILSEKQQKPSLWFEQPG
jgi:hypothetical protein